MQKLSSSSVIVFSGDVDYGGRRQWRTATEDGEDGVLRMRRRIEDGNVSSRVFVSEMISMHPFGISILFLNDDEYENYLVIVNLGISYRFK